MQARARGFDVRAMEALDYFDFTQAERQRMFAALENPCVANWNAARDIELVPGVTFEAQTATLFDMPAPENDWAALAVLELLVAQLKREQNAR